MSSYYMFPSFLMAGCYLMTPTLAHAEMPKTNINALLTYQYIMEENDDLSTANIDTAESHSLQGRLYIKSQFTPNIRSYLDLKALRIEGDTGAEDDTGSATSLESYLELRQAWIEHKMWHGKIPLSYKIGRQRIKEDSTLWWNRDFDAVKISYDTSLFKTQFAFGENLGSYRTTSDDFMRDDEKRFRIMGQSEWQWAYDHFITLRGHFENDHSGRPLIGQNVRIDDLDTVDMRMLWLGIDGRGTYQPKQKLPIVKNIHYQAQAMFVTGHEYLTQTAFIPASFFRNVTGINKQDVSGWAIDTSAQFALDATYNPVITIGYAYGSGDDDTTDRSDHAFRQTGMNGNSNLPFGTRTAIRKYGDVLRPELSNLHILTAGGSMDIFNKSQIHLISHYYHLDHTATSLRSSGISAPLDGRHKSVGFGTDLVMDYRLSDEWQGMSSLFGQSKIKLSLGHFIAGSAYGAAEGDQSIRAYSEFQFKF